MTARFSRIGFLILPLAIAGCQSLRPDVAGDVAERSGIDGAIVFRELPDASEPVAGATLTPAQAVRMALLHDPRIQTALAKVRAAEADADQARLLPNPILSIDTRFPQSAGMATAFEATLATELITLLQKPGQIAAADHRLRGAAAEALTTALDVISEVQMAYAAARSIEYEIANAKERDKILQHLREISEKRRKAGEANKLDVLTIDVQLMQASLDMNDLLHQRTEQRLLLARLIGQPRGAIEWELSPWEAQADVPLAEESAWLDAGLMKRPEIAAKKWELAALYVEAKSNWTWLQGTELGVHTEHDGGWRTGPTLAVPLPIFDWGQASGAKLEALRIAAVHEVAQQEAEVIEDIRLAYATLVQSRRALIDAREKLLPLQQSQMELAQKSYQAGESDLAALLLAETGMQLTLSKIAELSEKVIEARVKLERAAGGAGVARRIAAATQAATTAPATEPSLTKPAGGPGQ